MGISVDIINDILTTYALPGMILGFGLCFLAVMIPEREGLRGYRMARRMMGGAYIFFFVTLVVEAFIVNHSFLGSAADPSTLETAAQLPISLRGEVPSSATQQMLMVTICIVQAFLFTYALTTLIDVHFFTWRRLRREALLVFLPTTAVVTVSISMSYKTGGG